MSLLRVLMWSLALALLAWAAAVHGELPERSFLAWLGLPLVGVGLAAMMDGMTQWSLRNPQKQTLNLPQSDDLMALPVERRVPVLRRVASMSYAVTVIILVAFAVLQAGEAAAALGRREEVWVAVGIGLCVLGPLAVTVWGITAISSEIDRQKRAVQREGAA